MTDNTQTPEQNTKSQEDPPIFKHLSPKTQGLLRQIQRGREEDAQKHNMASEQTYVQLSNHSWYRWRMAVALTLLFSFIAIKPDGVQVRNY